MFSGILNLVHWHGRREFRRKDDLAERLKSAEERFEKTNNEQVAICSVVQKKIKRSETANNIALGLMGSRLCQRLSRGERHCEDCPLGIHCEFEKIDHSIEAMND